MKSTETEQTVSKSPDNGGYLTKTEIANFLKVCPRTVDQWQKRKLIPFLKIGKTVRFRVADVVSHLEKYRVN